MLESMKRLLKENHLCVLATSAENIPHCSLMTYVTNEAGDRMYMMTRRDSRKYASLAVNPQVSLLSRHPQCGRRCRWRRTQGLNRVRRLFSNTR